MQYVEIDPQTGVVSWDAYFDYLSSARADFPPDLYSYAANREHYSPEGRNTLHGAWLIGVHVAGRHCGHGSAQLSPDWTRPCHEAAGYLVFPCKGKGPLKETKMKQRLNPYAVAPELTRHLIDLAQRVAQSGLEPSLAELVKIRASQINGCAICLHMHTLNARKSGETEERIFMLDACQESPLYSDRERAALAWTEALTRLSETGAPDDVYQQVQAQFNEKELVTLTMMIAVINSFNRLGVGFRVAHPVSPERQAA